jgi:hypothetical protein
MINYAKNEVNFSRMPLHKKDIGISIQIANKLGIVIQIWHISL